MPKLPLQVESMTKMVAKFVVESFEWKKTNGSFIMNVVAKFVCEHADFKPEQGYTLVSMRPDFPRNDQPDHPNRKFWEATPSGSLQMCITNRDAAEIFIPGNVYKLTFEHEV